MTDLRKAAEMALDVLLDLPMAVRTKPQAQVIQALRQALAQPEQEPVAYTGNGTAAREADVRPTGFFFQMPKPIGEVYGWHGIGKGQPMCRFNASEAEMPVGTKLYTAPPKREWVGLTNADKQEAFDETQEASGGFWEFADYLDAKLKEKNL